MNIIGISGKIGSGKTTLSNHLIKRLGSTWMRVSFGDLLKKEVSDKFRFPLIYCYNDRKNEQVFASFNACTEKGLHTVPDAPFPTIRRLLQWWGTEVRRFEDPDYWIKAMQDALGKYRATGQLTGVIIDDVRFPNEAELVKKQGGLLIRLDPYPGWVCDQKAANHPSETALDTYPGWDYQLCPGQGELEAKGDWLLTEILSDNLIGVTNDFMSGSQFHSLRL